MLLLEVVLLESEEFLISHSSDVKSDRNCGTHFPSFRLVIFLQIVVQRFLVVEMVVAFKMVVHFNSASVIVERIAPTQPKHVQHFH